MKKRSYQPELLDAENIPQQDLFRNLRELHVINKLLGGYSLSISGLKKVLRKKPQIGHVMDIGFGGGDFLKSLSQFSQREKLDLHFSGVDIKADCVAYAKENLASTPGITLIESDYRNIGAETMKTVDLVHVSLFLHHLNDEDIVKLLQFCKAHNCMVLVNDLHRHPLAWLSIKWLTRFFSRSYLVKNDAPLSVKRGFSKNELQQFFRQAGFEYYEVKWVWAFRFMAIGWA
jgi:2-polyprenyl-3-methyl-5-hydroxy-6-metoxy-1,4-benzoquinol methylase